MGTFRKICLTLAVMLLALQTAVGGAAMARAAEEGYSICTPSGAPMTASAKAAAREFASLTGKNGPDRQAGDGDKCFLCHVAAAPALPSVDISDIPAPRPLVTQQRPLDIAGYKALAQGPPLGGRAPPFA